MWSRTSDPGPSMWNWFWGAESTAHKMRWIKGAHLHPSSGSCGRPGALWGEMTIFWRGHLERRSHFFRVFFSLDFWFVSHFPLVKSLWKIRAGKFKVNLRSFVKTQSVFSQRLPSCRFLSYVGNTPYGFDKKYIINWHGKDMLLTIIKRLAGRIGEFERNVTLSLVLTQVSPTCCYQ